MASQHELSILDFALSASPSPRSLMGILKAYGDESGDTADPGSPAFAMGAVIGQVQQWVAFRPRWEAMLLKHDIPELHMKLVVGAKKGTPFAKFGNVERLENLLKDAVQCIIDARLFCCSHTIFSDDLKKVLKEQGLKADPYSFALYQTVVHVGTWALTVYPNLPAFQLVMDRMQKGTAKEIQARELYDTDTFASWRGWPQINILDWKGEESSSNMYELQASDLVAWVTRRRQVFVEPWMRENKPTGKPDTYEGALWKWTRDRMMELRFIRPRDVLFVQAFIRLNMSGLLKTYFYNEFTLQNHVFVGRKLQVDPALKARSILAAGVAPLSP